MRTIIAIVGTIVVMTQAPIARGDDAPAMNDIASITVSGSAEVKVVPDIVRITIGVSKFNESVEQAKSENDKVMQGIIKVLADAELKHEDFQTECLKVDPIYDQSERYNERKDRLKGYQVTNKVIVTLKQVGRLESVILGSIGAGANILEGLQFDTIDLIKYRNEARRLAIRAAKEKATLFAGELGQDIGKAFRIREQGTNWWSGGQSQFSNSLIDYEGDDSGSGSTVSGGKIVVRASVDVTFELK